MSDASQPSSSETQRNERIARNVFFLAGGQVFSTILGLILTSALGRALGASDFGIYYIILTITSFVAVFVDWGQQTHVVKEIAKGRQDQARFLGSAALIRAVILVIAAILTPVLALATGYPAIVVWLTPLAVIASFPAAHALLLNHVFRGRDRMELDVASGLIQKFLIVVATLIALHLGGGITAAVLMPALGGIAGLAFSIAMARRLGIRLAIPAGGTVRETIGAGAAIVVMSLAISIHPLLDVTILSILTSPEVVGWLGAARAVIGILLAPALILATASFPDLCRVAHSPSELRKVISASSRLLVTAGALAFCLLFLFADTVIALIYGARQFDPAAAVLKVCAPFFPLFFVNFLIANSALAIGKSVEIAIAKFATVAGSAILSWYLIGVLQSQTGNGALGVMISYCLTELLMTVAYLFILPRGLLASSVWVHLLRGYASAILVCLLGAMIVPVLPLWLSAPLVLIGFLATALLTGLVDMNDIRTTNNLVRSVMVKLPVFKA